MPGILDGRVAIVTGAGRVSVPGGPVAGPGGGQGRGQRLRGGGGGTGGDIGPAAEVVEEIKKNGGEAATNGADVSNFDQAEALVRQAIDSYGKLDVLVNVAGILRDRMVFNLSWEDWDAVLRSTWAARSTPSGTRRRTGGSRNPDGHFRIINFTSGSGLHGAPGQPNYAAAKLGIVGLTYSCANALPRYGVTSNAIAPAGNTRMTQSIPTDRQRLRDVADDIMSPDNVAPAVAYLASDRSDWCNGQVILALGYQIGLYNVPEVIREVVRLRAPGTWDGGEPDGIRVQAGHPRQRDTGCRHGTRLIVDLSEPTELLGSLSPDAFVIALTGSSTKQAPVCGADEGTIPARLVIPSPLPVNRKARLCLKMEPC